MLIGDPVVYDGRTYVVVGFTPASVTPAEVQLRPRGGSATFWVERRLVIPAVAPAQELDQVVNAVEATYGKMADLQAEFTQVARNKSLGQDVKADPVQHRPFVAFQVEHDGRRRAVHEVEAAL